LNGIVSGTSIWREAFCSVVQNESKRRIFESFASVLCGPFDRSRTVAMRYAKRALAKNSFLVQNSSFCTFLATFHAAKAAFCHGSAVHNWMNLRTNRASRRAQSTLCEWSFAVLHETQRGFEKRLVRVIKERVF
jgi:hypothetical protein